MTTAVKAIKEKDSLSQVISESNINSLGYTFIRNNDFDLEVNFFLPFLTNCCIVGIYSYFLDFISLSNI